MYMFRKLNIDYRIRVHYSILTGSKPITEIKFLFPYTLSPLTQKKETKQIQIVALIKTIIEYALQTSSVRLTIHSGADITPCVSDLDLSLWLTKKKVPTWKQKWAQPLSPERKQGSLFLKSKSLFRSENNQTPRFLA